MTVGEVRKICDGEPIQLIGSRTGKKLGATFQGGSRSLVTAVPKARGFKSRRTPAQVVYLDHLNAFAGKTALGSR